MSLAFDRAMDEVARIWETSDKFDSKVLNFISIVSAGALAAAAIAVKQLPFPHPLHWLVTTLIALGVAALVAFIMIALGSATPADFAAPLDPRLLANAPEYLGDNDAFELAMLPLIGEAYETCHSAQQRKATTFSKSFVWLRAAVICLAAAVAIYILIPAKGAKSVSDNKPSPPPAASPSTTPTTQPATPALGPVIVTKGPPSPKTTPNLPTKPR